MKLVKVTWLDAVADHEDVGHGPEKVRSVGFLLQDDAEGIRLAGCIETSDNNPRRTIFIPRGSVQSVRTYR
jgi:hypothetical protein